MTDIVERLRKREQGEPDAINAILFAQAADEIERLRAGGCARDQRTTQWCAEAVALRAELETVSEKLMIACTDNAGMRADLADCRMQLDASCNAEELRQARAELAACREDAERWRNVRGYVAAVEAEWDALWEDAERYRYIRDNHEGTSEITMRFAVARWRSSTA